MKQIQQLKDRVKRDILQVKSSSDTDESILAQLRSVISYIDSGLSQFKGFNRVLSITEQVKQYEAEVYRLLESIGKLDQEASDKEFQEVKSRLNTIVRNISEFRKKLETEIGDPNRQNGNTEEAKKAVLHLEDLQENLADLGYTFNSKLDLHKKDGAQRPQKTAQHDAMFELW